MAEKLSPGDSVEWNTPQGKTEGTIEKKLTEPTQIKGHTAKASPDHPEFLVKTDQSHKEAAHTPEELEKTSH